MKVIIVGGGIGGLSAAIALERVGVQSAVFEQADRLREVGSGVTLWVNATKALRKMGAADGLLARGSAEARFEVRNWRGDALSAAPFARIESKFRAPANICVHRGEFLEQLARLVDPARIHCGARCTGFDEDHAGVTVRFANGSEERGDALVGADGLHSVVRALLHGESKPRYAGYTCWRGLAQLAHKALPTDLAYEAWGPGKRFSVHHCGLGRIFWFGTKNAPEGAADAPGGRKAEVLACFRDWVSPIPELIEASQEGILRNDIVDRKPLTSWGRGRVTLLGDAAHPTTPNLGQGACQAIEDAVTLAHCFGQGDNAQRILRSYESRRIPRTNAITRQSLRLGMLGQLENPLACALRDAIIRITPSAISLRFMESILRSDVPALP
jgi:2-polyprenyl-6-methoxyphenol hydroxylase-like FAD-dependent oxidoreductase